MSGWIVDEFPKPSPGFTRTWVRCKKCREVYYRDYIPYSLSNPVIWLPCGHTGGGNFYDTAEPITEQQAREHFGIFTYEI